MTRLFIPEKNIDGGAVRITGDDAHYLAHVLRLQVGDSFEVVVPDTKEYTVNIERITPDSVQGRITASLQRATEPQLSLTLYQAILKGKNFPLVIQKAVELGVGAIVPLKTRRTVVRLSDSEAEKRRQRWQRIAREAAEQSERITVPAVATPLDFQPALEQWQRQNAPGLIFAARAVGRDGCSLHAVLGKLEGTGSLAIFIGPEGGFSTEEIENGIRAGLREVSLGRRILRAETAAIVACGLCMYELDKFTPSDQIETSVKQ